MRKVRESESEGSCEDDEESVQMTYLCRYRDVWETE